MKKTLIFDENLSEPDNLYLYTDLHSQRRVSLKVTFDIQSGKNALRQVTTLFRTRAQRGSSRQSSSFVDHAQALACYISRQYSLSSFFIEEI